MYLGGILKRGKSLKEIRAGYPRAVGELTSGVVFMSLLYSSENFVNREGSVLCLNP